MTGYVYIIECDRSIVKIGISTRPSSRLKTIEMASGRAITQKFISPPCDNYGDIENKLHQKFRPKNKIGEWFLIPFQDAVDEFYRLTSISESPDTAIERAFKIFAPILAPSYKGGECQFYISYGMCGKYECPIYGTRECDYDLECTNTVEELENAYFKKYGHHLPSEQ